MPLHRLSGARADVARYTLTVEAPGARHRVVSERAEVWQHTVDLVAAMTEHRGPGARLWVTAPSAFVGVQYVRRTCDGASWRRVAAFETPFEEGAT